MKPEILAPVGSWEMCLAAVHNGADAIYVGAPAFNARGRTQEFSLEELNSIIKFCHLYGVKVFLALNVLVFESELEEVSTLIRQLVALNPDAFIVQDIGVVRLIKKIAPDQIVHASTQMTITSHEAIELVSELGMSRYVLAREVSIPEMKRIKEKTDAELEVFVHGALCVSYSGQCLTSERQGGRSANRGQCAQSCRLPYDLVVDGERKEMGEKRYLVSPKDLCGLDVASDLKELGISSFKIEGRLKSPEYVASTVKSYRDALDQNTISTIPSENLSTFYSRGFFSGWLNGVDHQTLVDSRYSNHHGAYVGKVAGVQNNEVRICTSMELFNGDGLVFCDFNTGLEIGSFIYRISSNNKKNQIDVQVSSDLNITDLYSGMEVFRNSSSKLSKETLKTFNDKTLLKRIPIDLELKGQVGAKLQLIAKDSDSNQVLVESENLLEAARSNGADRKNLLEEISALSGTCFVLRNFKNEVSDNCFVPNKELKVLRQNVTALLAKKRTSRNPIEVLEDQRVKSWIHSEDNSQVKREDLREESLLSVVLREPEQAVALEGLKLGVVYLDFEHGKDSEPTLKLLKDWGHKVGIATTRILKPGELGHLKYISRLKPDAILVRNLGALQFFQDSPFELVADFSLNVSNHLSASWMLSKGLSRLTPSYDLNQEQLLELVTATDSRYWEVTVHQYMPSFHMEHCVFAAFLSNGSSYRDCGRPCERHRVDLRDPSGALHPLKADAECRNTMFHGVAQSSARLLPRLLDAGVRNFRIEALFESKDELKEKIEIYQNLLSNKPPAVETLRLLNSVEKYGVSDGQLLKIGKFKDRKKTSSPIEMSPWIQENLG